MDAGSDATAAYLRNIYVLGWNEGMSTEQSAKHERNEMTKKMKNEKMKLPEQILDPNWDGWIK